MRQRSSATASDRIGEAAGPAHVATVSFLASRAVPTGGFWVALAGGMALARVAHRGGARLGYGASVAATLETVAIIGPARFSVPFTQALSAPLLGRLEARGRSPLAQILVCAAIRVLSNAAGVAFFIWVVAGGLDAYAGSYEALAERVGIGLGEGGTLLVTALGLIAWGAFASTMQVSVYRRGLRAWPQAGGTRADVGQAQEPSRGRFDPRAVALAAAAGFALLLAGTSWALLATSAAWLALATAVSRPDRRAAPTGLALAAALAFGALVFTLGGGLGLEEALRRASRAALLVLVATWLRAAAGAAGLREVFRRALARLRRLPSFSEATLVLDAIGSEGRLRAAGRSLVDRLRGVERQPVPFLDAVLDWVAKEAGAYPAGTPTAALALRTRPVDVALVATALLPALALAL